MPDVVKEIYLPVTSGTYSFDEYKKVTGVDLDMFRRGDNIDFGNSKLYLTDPFYAMVEGGSGPVAYNGVYPVVLVEDDNDTQFIYNFCALNAIFQGGEIKNIYIGLKINFDTLKVSFTIIEQ